MISQVRLIEMYMRESGDSREGFRLLLFAFISSIANTLLLIVINSAAHVADKAVLSLRYFILFGSTLGVFIITQRYILTRAVTISEHIIDRIRNRVADKVRKCHFLAIEKLGHTEIYSKLTKDTVVVTQASPLVMNALQSAMMVFSVCSISHPFLKRRFLLPLR